MRELHEEEDVLAGGVRAFLQAHRLLGVHGAQGPGSFQGGILMPSVWEMAYMVGGTVIGAAIGSGFNVSIILTAIVAQPIVILTILGLFRVLRKFGLDAS